MMVRDSVLLFWATLYIVAR